MKHSHFDLILIRTRHSSHYFSLQIHSGTRAHLGEIRCAREARMSHAHKKRCLSGGKRLKHFVRAVFGGQNPLRQGLR
jgi:hypothetical protein